MVALYQMALLYVCIGLLGAMALGFLIAFVSRQMGRTAALLRKSGRLNTFLSLIAVTVMVAYGGTKPTPEPPGPGPVTTVTVTFDANGGEGGTTRTIDVGAAVGELPTATRVGCELLGWFRAASGGIEITASTKVTGNVTYYAHWAKNKYTVTLDRQGGSGGTASVAATYGSSMPAIAVPTRADYTFVGYFSDVNGAGTQYYTASGTSARTWDKMGAATLYAYWKSKSTPGPGPGPAPDPGPDPVYEVAFGESEALADEGANIVVRVVGGNAEKAGSVAVYLTYNTAAAADLDLKNGSVDGATPKGGLKFPLTLSWAKGEIGERVVTIPVKADKAVEADEFFTLQLADAQGMGLGEARICTVTVHDPGYDALAAKIADGTAAKAETTVWNKLQAAKAPYVRGLADPADGGKVTGSGLCAVGRKVTLKATANKNFKFLGWRQAGASAQYVATTQSLVIDRTAKPAANTKTSTTMAGTEDDVTFYAEFRGDPRVAVVVESTDANGAAPTGKGAGKYVAGSITGVGRYPAGKAKIVLKATANKGYVFAGWLDADGALLSKEASYTIPAMGEEDVEYTARFITAAEDRAAITLSVDGNAISPQPATHNIDIWCGVAVSWPVTSGGLSATTVKAAGLPAGLKLVQDKATKAWSVAGAPTVASKVDVKTKAVMPSKAKFTVTTAGKSSQTFMLDIYVEALPAWAVGTFDGIVEAGGLVQSLMVSAAGKVSGKLLSAGKTWTLSASAFSEVGSRKSEAGSLKSEVESPVFYATVVGKSGKEVTTNVVAFAEEEVGGSVRGVAVSDGWAAWQNLWKAEPWKTEAKAFAKAPALMTADGVSLKFAATGAVTAKYGAYSSTSVLIPVDSPSTLDSQPSTLNFNLYLYIPPKAGKFEGYAAELELVWDGTAFSPVELQ